MSKRRIFTRLIEIHEQSYHMRKILPCDDTHFNNSVFATQNTFIKLEGSLHCKETTGFKKEGK